jgi:hypothetical protein
MVDLGEWISTTLAMAARRAVGSPVGQAIHYSVFSVSAEIPVSIWTVFSPRRQRFLLYFAVSLFFTLLLPLLLTLSAGVLWLDNDPERLTFLEDRWNVILYLVICPGYISVCILMLGASVAYWANMPAGHGTPARWAVVRNRRFVLSIAVCLLFSSALTVNYIYDTVFKDSGYLYWFLDAPGQVNRAGFYYIILNYSMMLLTIISILAYVGTAISAISEISALTAEDAVNLPLRIVHIERFWEIMTLARILAALYIGNVYIWQFSPLGDPTVANLLIAIGAITAVGIVGTILPKTIADAKFKELRAVLIENRVDPDKIAVVPSGINFWGRIADRIVVASFPVTMVGLLIGTNIEFVELMRIIFDPGTPD